METFNFSQDITVGMGQSLKAVGKSKSLEVSMHHHSQDLILRRWTVKGKEIIWHSLVDIKADTFTDIEANPSVTTGESHSKIPGVGRRLYRGIRRWLTDGCGKSRVWLPNMAEVSQTMREHTRCRD